MPVQFPALTGNQIEVAITGAQLKFTRNYYSRQLEAFPVGIAELGIPGVLDPPAPAAIPALCRNDLLAVDGAPIWVQVSGASASALAGQGLAVRLCGPDAGGLRLGPGRHVLEAANGALTGWNVDQLALDSAPGGGPEPDLTPSALAAPPTPGPVPTATVTSQSATTIHVRLSALGSGNFHLVLGESENQGWTATIDGGGSLGPPELIDGFANGWTVTPSELRGHLRSGTASITLRWEPQQIVWTALGVSAFAFGASVAVAFWPAPLGRRRNAERRAAARTRHRETSIDRPGGRPTLTAGLVHFEGRAGWITTALTAVVLGGVLAAVTRPAIGAAVGLAAAVSLLIRRARGLLAWASIGLAVAAGAIVVIDQATHPAAPGGTWAPTFTTAAYLAWAAVACLAADAIVEGVRRLRARTAAARSTAETQPEPAEVESSPPVPLGPDVD